MVEHVDFVNLMSYDLHGSWNNFTGLLIGKLYLYSKTFESFFLLNSGIHSALFQSSQDTTDELKQLNVDAIVHYWLAHGCPREKLILGIPTYGRTFTLANVANNDVGAFAIGPGSIGSFVPEAGFLPFNEICYNAGGWTRTWESQQKVPYAVKNDQWVGYEDLESLTIKLNYILANDLGGAMFWSLETDDFG